MTLSVDPLILPLQAAPETSHQDLAFPDCLQRLKDLEIPCQIRLGSLTLTLAQLQNLKKGQQLVLNESLDEPLDLLVNQQVVARGELMSHEDFFALHISEVLR